MIKSKCDSNQRLNKKKKFTTSNKRLKSLRQHSQNGTKIDFTNSSVDENPIHDSLKSQTLSRYESNENQDKSITNAIGNDSEYSQTVSSTKSFSGTIVVPSMIETNLGKINNGQQTSSSTEIINNQQKQLENQLKTSSKIIMLNINEAKLILLSQDNPKTNTDKLNTVLKDETNISQPFINYHQEIK